MTPILVIGIDRSGTKWLSNMLCNHPDVAGVQGERSGIMETNMFGPLRSKFDLKHPGDYIALIELWSRTPFFEITQVDKQFFYRLQPWPTDSYRLFGILMEHYARRNDCSYWLQKISPLEALNALNAFNDARIILIKRSLMETLRSLIQKRVSRGNKKSLLRAIYDYVLQEKILRKIRKKARVIETTYEQLVADTDAELHGICRSLGLGYHPDLSQVRFRSNTSFKPGMDRKATFTRLDEARIHFMAMGMRLMPWWVLYGTWKVWDRIRGPRLIKRDTFTLDLYGPSP